MNKVEPPRHQPSGNAQAGGLHAGAGDIAAVFVRPSGSGGHPDLAGIPRLLPDSDDPRAGDDVAQGQRWRGQEPHRRGHPERPRQADQWLLGHRDAGRAAAFMRSDTKSSIPSIPTIRDGGADGMDVFKFTCEGGRDRRSGRAETEGVSARQVRIGKKFARRRNDSAKPRCSESRTGFTDARGAARFRAKSRGFEKSIPLTYEEVDCYNRSRHKKETRS